MRFLHERPLGPHSLDLWSFQLDCARSVKLQYIDFLDASDTPQATDIARTAIPV